MKAPKTDVAPYSPSGTCNAKIIMIMLILYSGRSNNTTEGSDDLEQS